MTSFVEALGQQASALAEACTQCGRCFQACPMTGPVGLSGADPKAVLGGMISLLKGEAGTVEAQTWAGSCTSSGQCRDACDYGVDPRLLVRLAHYAHVRQRDGAAVKANAMTAFRNMAKSLRIVSRLQLDPATLATLQSDPAAAPAAERPDIVLYTGCNVGKTPHILLLVLDVLRALDLSWTLVGGPTACCGVNQFRAGDGETSGRAGLSALDQIQRHGASANVAWCPSCQSQFDDVVIPGYKRTAGGPDFELVPFFVFLERHLDRLPTLFRPVSPRRVALHEGPGYPAVVSAVERILGMVPGIELVKLDVPRAGLMANYLTVAPRFKEGLRETEFAAAAQAGVTTIATIFHACHRELCHHDGAAFEVLNVMEIIGESIGASAEDAYKRLKMAHDVDAMMDSCADLIAQHRLDPDEARTVLLADQLAARPLQGAILEV